MAKEKTLSIAERAAAKLNVSDNDNIGKFYTAVVAKLNNQIEDRKIFISIEETQWKREKAQQEQAIEDAQNEVEDAFITVDVEKLKTNASRSSFIDEYWNRVKAAQRNLASLESTLEDSQKAFDEKIEQAQLEIAQLEDYLSKLK
jgi:hypothetical protein